MHDTTGAKSIRSTGTRQAHGLHPVGSDRIPWVSMNDPNPTARITVMTNVAKTVMDQSYFRLRWLHDANQGEVTSRDGTEVESLP
jgi:hypothetical protein